MKIFTISEAVLEAAQALRKAGVAGARADAALLLTHVIECDRTYIITHADDALTPAEFERFRALVTRRADGEPVQYITGRQEFWRLDFEVTPDVLIPRPETELLVETALKLLERSHSNPLICDVGTGSGCIAVSLLHERAELRAVGLDISPAALRIAARNAERHDVGDRFLPLASDCFAALNPSRAQFSLIAANPPYIAEDVIHDLQREVRDYEPREALTPGGDGLDAIRRLLTDAPRFLSPSGHLLLEIGFDQHERVAQLIDTRIWQLLDIHKDLQGIPRTVALRMQET